MFKEQFFGRHIYDRLVHSIKKILYLELWLKRATIEVAKDLKELFQ